MKFHLIHTPLVLATTLVCGQTADKWGDLSDYPLSDKLWIAGQSGEVEVNPVTELMSPRHGEIKWEKEDGAAVQEGDVLLYFEAEKIDQSARQLALTEDSQDIKLKELQWSHAEKIRALKEQVATLQSEIRKMELSPQERKLIGEGLAARLEEQKAEKTEDLIRLKEKIDPELLARQLDLGKRELAQDLERARSEHEALKRSLASFAEHEGTLVRLKEGVVRPGTKVGELVQNGKAIVKLSVTDPYIRSMAEDKLMVSVTGPRGEEAEGRFSHFGQQVAGGIGPKLYIFKLVANEGEELGGDFSGDRMIRIYQQLDEKAHIVRKSKMLFSEPEKIQEKGWKNFLKSVWPDAEIVQIGPTAIAIKAK